jgi:hypothetical protein
MSARPTICPTKLSRMLTLVTEVKAVQRPDLATILRPSTISDEAGGFVETLVPVQTGIDVRVDAQGMQPWEKIDRIGDRIISTNVFLIAMPAGTDVLPTDRIRVDTLGVSYDVIGVDGPHSYEVERVAQTVRVY